MKECVRCGAELGRYQLKYCNECSNIIHHEQCKELKRKRKAEGKKQKAGNESSHLEWEADICLNCKRPSCNDCLQGKTIEQKQEMLRRSGGKRWLD